MIPNVRTWVLIFVAVVPIVSLGLLISGCDEDPGSPFVLSVHPLYLESDAEFDPTLLGKWVDSDGDVTFHFETSPDPVYKLKVVERNSEATVTGEFKAHLVRIGNTWFLDIFPEEKEGGSEFYRTHFVRAHTFARVQIDHDSLQVSFLASTWLKQRFDDKTVDTAHEVIEGTPVLTATTEELQSLVDRFAKDDEAFPDPLVLKLIQEQKGEE